MDDVKKKLAKILALAERGVGGEKENAQKILQKMLDRHGITIDELLSDSSFVPEKYTYCSQWDKRLLVQCIVAVTGMNTEMYCIPGKKKLLVNIRRIDHIELNAMYDFYKKLFREEQENFLNAFIHKHHIFAPDAPKSNDPFDLEQMDKLVSAMRALSDQKFVSTRRQLAGVEL